MKEFYKNLLVPELTIVKRENEIKRSLSDFIRLYSSNFDSSSFKVIDNVANYISSLYHSILYKNVKKYIQSKTSKYKMASLTELCVVHIQPFRCEDIGVQRLINAQFAFYLSVGIIESITPDAFDKNIAVKPISDFYDEVRVKHLEWLKIKAPEMMCVISNEHTLALIHHFYQHRWSSMQGQ